MLQLMTNYKKKKNILNMTNGPIISRRDQEELKKYKKRKEQLLAKKEIREKLKNNIKNHKQVR